MYVENFTLEANAKTLVFQQEIAETVERFLVEQLSDIKAIGFHQGGQDDGLLKWHITQLIMEQAVLRKYYTTLNLKFPKYAGHEVFVCGVEDSTSQGGGLTIAYHNACGDRIECLEFFVSSLSEKILDFGYIGKSTSRINTALNIAKGKMNGFSENDMLEVADFIKNGWAKKDDEDLRLCIPVYTAEQYEQVIAVMNNVTDKIMNITREMVAISTDILLQHTPASLKKDAKAISWLKRHDLAMTRPVEIMRDNGVLRRVTDNEHPSVYVVLK